MIFDEKEQRQAIKYLNISRLFKGASLESDKIPWFSGTCYIAWHQMEFCSMTSYLGRLHFLESENSSMNTRALPMAMYSSIFFS